MLRCLRRAPRRPDRVRRSDHGSRSRCRPWNSQPKTALALVQRECILEILPPRGVSAETLIGKDAARHMKCLYLEGSGRPLTIDLDRMVRDVPSAKKRFLTKVSHAKTFVVLGTGCSRRCPGRWHIAAARCDMRGGVIKSDLITTMRGDDGMTINEELRWLDDGSFERAGLTPHQMREARSAFVGIPRRVLLESGERLYRYQEGSSGSHSGRVPHWWLPERAVDEIRRLRRETQLSFEEVVRAVAGLAFDFQTRCDFELRARLLRPAYAFRGPVSRQSLLAHPYSGRSRARGWNPELARLWSVTGYLEQFFIPNLTPADVSVGRWGLSKPAGGFSLLG